MWNKRRLAVHRLTTWTFLWEQITQPIGMNKILQKLFDAYDEEFGEFEERTKGLLCRKLSITTNCRDIPLYTIGVHPCVRERVCIRVLEYLSEGMHTF